MSDYSYLDLLEKRHKKLDDKQRAVCCRTDNTIELTVNEVNGILYRILGAHTVKAVQLVFGLHVVQFIFLITLQFCLQPVIVIHYINEH